MSELTDKFIKMVAEREDPTQCYEAAEMVLSAPETPESTGLCAYLYHEGIGVEEDMDKCFELAEKAADGGDGLGYFLLGFMCDNIETPDQEEGGPRQKYDHYDAERFYEKCANIDSRWRPQARLWLGDYYMDSARGGDPEIGLEYYESIAEDNFEAAGKLSDYYWDLVLNDYTEDEDRRSALFKWTEVAAELDPDEYLSRMGWIYAQGFGCEPSNEKALEFFDKAYTCGDWRGAKGAADLMQAFLEASPDLSGAEKKELQEAISEWNERAEEMRLEDLLNDPDECAEED